MSDLNERARAAIAAFDAALEGDSGDAEIDAAIQMRELLEEFLGPEHKGEPEEEDLTALWTPEMTAAAIRERAQGPAETFGRMYELNEHSEEL